MTNFKMNNRSTLAKVDNLHLLHLVGNDYRRANDHGILLKGVVSNGALKSLVNLFDDRFVPILRSEKSIIYRNSLIAFKNLYKKYFLKRSKISNDAQNEVKGLADAIGVCEEIIKAGLLGPDMVSVLGAIGSSNKLAERVKFPSLGCTTFTLFNPANSKELLFGRNLDYPSGGLFEKYPLISFHEPDDGQKYITFTSCGVHTAGLASINESGLIFAINQNFTRAVNIFGSPAIAILNDVAKKSKSMDEALSELKRSKFIAGWTITIVDINNGTGCIAEITGKSFSTRHEEGGILIATNNFQGIAKVHEYYPNYSHHLSSRFRFCRGHEILKENIINFGKLNPITLLSDRNTTINKSFIGALSGTHNIQTLYIDTRNDSLYISISDISPTAFGNFAKIKFSDFFKKNFTLEKTLGTIEIIKQEISSNSEKVFRGFYRQSYLEHERCAYNESLDNLEIAVSRDTTNFHYPFLAAILSFKMGNIEQSEKNLKIAESRNPSNHQRSLIYLFTGRLFDIKREREKAKESYGLAFQYAVCDSVKNELLKGLKKPYDYSKRNRILIDFMYGDLHTL